MWHRASMGERSETEGLLQWLEESGRALELRVLRAFRRHAEARHAVYHRDQESGKPREVDVMARFHGSRGGVSRPHFDVVVECKTGKPGSQWVAFRDESTPARFPPAKDLWLAPSEPGRKTSFEGAWDWRPPFSDRVNVSSIVTAHDGRDSAHAAVQQVLSAVEAQIDHVRRHEVQSAQRVDQSSGAITTWSTTEVGVMGLVVTTVPIYVAELGDDNSPRVTPVEVVAVPTGWEAPAGPVWVFIARETALRTTVSDLSKAAERL